MSWVISLDARVRQDGEKELFCSFGVVLCCKTFRSFLSLKENSFFFLKNKFLQLNIIKIFPPNHHRRFPTRLACRSNIKKAASYLVNFFPSQPFRSCLLPTLEVSSFSAVRFFHS